MDVLSLALVLAGIAVADDILNDKLRLGAKLADLFSRLFCQPDVNADRQLKCKETAMRMK